MANWDKFWINESSGKVTIKKVNGETLEGLDVLKLSGKTYFADKELLRELKSYSPENLENIPIYSLVGRDFDDKNRGITVEIHGTKFATELTDMVRMDNEYLFK